MRATPSLRGLRVLELGDGVAGANCGRALAMLGAQVTKFAHERGPDDLRRSGDDGDVPDATSLLWTLLDRDKDVRSAPERFEAEFAHGFDIVICDRASGSDDWHVAMGDYRDWVSTNNASVWISITPFGLTGPHCGYHADELVIASAGGMLANVAESAAGGRPVLLPGHQALKLTGWIAALGAMHGCDRFRRDQRAVHLDVSVQEAVVMTAALPECAHAIFECQGRAGGGRYLAPTGNFPTRDGAVRVTAVDDHHWQAMVRTLGRPSWSDGLESRPARIAHADTINQEIARWTSTRLKVDCADSMQREGVPATPINSPADVLRSPQFIARDFLDRVPTGKHVVRSPGSPIHASFVPEDSTHPVADRFPDGLRSLRVAEFVHVLAGPMAGALLGAMGAQVVRFEDLDRLDMYRRIGPFAQNIPGIERGAYFAIANHSTQSLAVDVSTDADAARRLVCASDVVLESFGQKRMRALGVNDEQLASLRNDLLSVSISGFGNSGPLSHYKAFANNVHGYGGMSYLTRTTTGEIAYIGAVLADPLSSVVTALGIAAWAIGGGKSGGRIDISMAEVVAYQVAEFIAEASLQTEAIERAQCDPPSSAPHGVFPVSGDRWLALSVDTDAAWQALRAVLGDPEELAPAEWQSANGRRSYRQQIHEALADLLAARDATALFHDLQRAGVPAAPVMDAHALLADPHLADRGFFPEVAHADLDLGHRRIVGLPWRFAGDPPIRLAPAPRLGSVSLQTAIGG